MGSGVNAPSYSIFSPRNKTLSVLCAKCQKEYEYRLTSEEIGILRRDNLTDAYLNDLLSEKLYIAQEEGLCMDCYNAKRDMKYRELMGSIDIRFKSMVDEYIFGIGDNIEDLNIWLGTKTAKAVYEYRQEFYK